jgi:hypothetical protein
VVRAEERKGKTLAEILAALNAAERNMTHRTENYPSHRQPNRAGGVSEITGEDREDEGPVAAADRGRGRGRGGRGGRGRGGQASGHRTNQGSTTEGETRTCFWCKEVGHIKPNCPKRSQQQGAGSLKEGEFLPLTWQGNGEADV